jgi:hypothetical protein
MHCSKTTTSIRYRDSSEKNKRARLSDSRRRHYAATRDVEVRNVALDDLRESPYSERIVFEKVFTNPSDHRELKRGRWTASVTWVFSPSVRNSELAVNPLALTIADQALR